MAPSSPSSRRAVAAAFVIAGAALLVLTVAAGYLYGVT